jgi:hypothetical protein
MANSKIEKLSERVDELACGSGQGPTLTTEEANTVREFWINLHVTPEEGDEYSRNEERLKYLHTLWRACKWTKEYEMEQSRLSERNVELDSDIVANRVIANHAMRDRVWPDLAPRVLRFRKLEKKPREELTDAEAEEWKGLLEWFSKLRQEVHQTRRETPGRPFV